MKLIITYTRHSCDVVDRVVEDPKFIPAVGDKIWMNWNGMRNTVIEVVFGYNENEITIHTEQ